MASPESLPDDLIELQLAVLRAELTYQEKIGALYSHPWMRQARATGRLDQVSAELRAAARAA